LIVELHAKKKPRDNAGAFEFDRDRFLLLALSLR